MVDALPVVAAEAEVAVGCLHSPVGPLSVRVTSEGLAGVRWGGLDEVTGARAGGAGLSVLARALEQLAGYFAGELTAFELPLDLRGLSSSRRQVLQTLAETVPYGSSITYGELAHRSRTGVPARGIGRSIFEDCLIRSPAYCVTGEISSKHKYKQTSGIVASAATIENAPTLRRATLP